MKDERKSESEQTQPEPFTPGITRGMVREHAFRLYRDKLERSTLSLEDWVLAEKDLVQTRMNEGIERT